MACVAGGSFRRFGYSLVNKPVLAAPRSRRRGCGDSRASDWSVLREAIGKAASRLARTAWRGRRQAEHASDRSALFFTY